MNKTLYLLIAVLAFTSCANTYNIQGSSNVTDLDGRMLYLKVLENNDFKSVDSCDVTHGQFHFTGHIDTARMANIFMDDESVLTFVLEEGDINIKINNTQQTVSGTPLNEKLFKFFKEYNQLKNREAELVHKHDQAIMNGNDMALVNAELNAEAAKLSQKEDHLVTTFVTDNFDNVLGPGVFFMVTIGNQYPELTPWIEDIMSKATDQFKNDPYVKDYITTPKFNLYQSIHTTVIGPDNRSLEIQIRTYDMHRRAEYGVAAHWRYKENPNATKRGGGAAKVDEETTQLNWLRQLVDWQRETADPAEFLESLSYEISGNKVYVFTPAGEVMELPTGATPVDFAYAVHTEVGHRTVGARVNDRLVTLDHKLESGDTVEIITAKSPDAGPSLGWLDFVASPRARAKIRVWFKKSRRDEAVEEGKDKLARAIRKRNQPVQRLMSHDTLAEVAREAGRSSVDDLYAGIGEGDISPETVVRNLITSQGGQAGVEETLAEAVTPNRISRRRSTASTDNAVVVQGMEAGDVMVKLARCCTPVPPDAIVGFVTRGSGVSIHRADCPNVEQLQKQPERFLEVHWADDSEAVYVIQVQVDALDRQGLLSDISRALLDNGVNLLAGNMMTTKERMVRNTFTFEMADPHHLARVLADLRKIEGVYDAYRVTNSKPANQRRVEPPRT